MRIRKSIGYDILIMVTFFLLDRTTDIYPLNNTIIDQIVPHASRLTAVAVIFVWVLFMCKGYKSRFWGGLPCIIWFYASLLFSTFMHHGSVYHVGMTAYPIIAICMLTIISCRTKEKMKRFIHAIANLYFLLGVINFIMLPASDQLYPASYYFLGNENGVGYPLSLGFLFCYLDNYYNHHSKKYIIYLIIYCITLFYIFSGSNVIGMLIVLTFLYIRPFQRMLSKFRFSVIVLLYLVLFLLVLFYSDTFFSLAPVKYFIEDFLGKSLTLTNRTIIWGVALVAIAKAPLFGHGMRDTVNLFTIHVYNAARTYSAHNQFLQSLYEGGIASMVPMVLFLLSTGRNLSRCRDSKILLLFKTFLLATLVMLLAEATGWSLLFYIGNLSIVICGVVRQEETDENLKPSNLTTPSVAEGKGQ